MIMPMYTMEGIYTVLYFWNPCFDFTLGQWLLPAWLNEWNNLSSSPVYLYWYDNGLIEEGCGDIGLLITLNCSCCRCSPYRGAWADSQNLQLFFIYSAQCVQSGAPAQAQTAFQHRWACLLCYSVRQLPPPLLPLSLPEKEREMSQLDSNQSKRKRETEELWRVLSFSLWDHFKDRPAKIALKATQSS